MMVDEASNYLVEAVIPAGGSLSPEVALPSSVAAVIMPATWDAASLTFQGGAVSGALGKVTAKGGTEYTLTVVAGDTNMIPTDDFAGIRYVKVRSGTAAAPVNQAAARTIQLVCRLLRR